MMRLGRAAAVAAGMLVPPTLAAAQDRAPAKPATFTARPPAAARPLTAAERRRLVDYLPAERIEEQRILRSGALGTTLHMSADEENAWILVRRTTDSQIERHARWDDFVMVRGGRGGVLIGKRAKGMTPRARGEDRGGELVDAYRLGVKPGDLVRIPAGVPHAFVVDSGATLEYLVMKIHRPELKLP